MARSKPVHQWETRGHLAIRGVEKPVRGFEHDPRAEAFELHFHDGRIGHARLGLARQEVDVTAESDPDLVHAVKCWLCARGERSIHLEAASDQGRVIAAGAFTPADLSDVLAFEPRTLITLCPSNAELVYALGRFDRVIACEDSSDYPESVAGLERLGPDLGPDLDRVTELRPHAVIASLSVPGMERIVTGLRARGMPQLVLAPRSVSEVLSEMAWLAEALGAVEEGKVACARMQHEIDALEANLRRDSKPPLRVYLEWWPKPMFTPGGRCYSNELIRLAGGRNVFEDKPGSSLEITSDELLQKAPEVCFVSWCGVALNKLDPDNLIERPGLSGLHASQVRNVFPLDERFSGRPGPRMLEAARIMAEGIQRARNVSSE